MNLKPFLALVLRGGEQRDLWMKTLLGQLAGHIQSLDIFANIDVRRLTPIQTYATVWMAQIHLYKRTLQTHSSRLRSLNCDDFYRAPRSVLAAAGRFLDIPFTATHLDETMARPLWNEHAKIKGSSFTNANREEQLAELYRRFENQIAQGLSFAERLGVSSESLASPLDIGT